MMSFGIGTAMTLASSVRTVASSLKTGTSTERRGWDSTDADSRKPGAAAQAARERPISRPELERAVAPGVVDASSLAAGIEFVRSLGTMRWSGGRAHTCAAAAWTFTHISEAARTVDFWARCLLFTWTLGLGEIACGKAGVAARWPLAASVQRGLGGMSGSKAREAEGRVPPPADRGAAERTPPDRH